MSNNNPIRKQIMINKMLHSKYILIQTFFLSTPFTAGLMITKSIHVHIKYTIELRVFANFYNIVYVFYELHITYTIFVFQRLPIVDHFGCNPVTLASANLVGLFMFLSQPASLIGYSLTEQVLLNTTKLSIANIQTEYTQTYVNQYLKL